MKMLLKLLEENGRYTVSQLASMLDCSAKDVEKAIKEYQDKGIICGYKAIINWDKVDNEHVTALIELKVTPKRDFGFEEIAERILEFDEVEGLYLVSGSYDMAVTVTGKTFKEIAMFVAKRLATLDSVISTATHFVLRRYKDSGVIIDRKKGDERGSITL